MQENMDLMKSFHTAAALLPERLWRAAYSLSEEQRAQCEELRVRLDRPLAATVAGKTVRLGKEPVLPVKAELDELLARATESSVHTYLEQLRQGFLTTKYGHRIGLCAQAPEGRGRALRGLSSVNIRVARQLEEAGSELPIAGPGGFQSTLILAPPGAGKTTLLRACIRTLSQMGQCVSVADERGEIAAFPLGSRVDVLRGCGKQAAMERLLRVMGPEWIAVDEISAEADVLALEKCSYCGVKLMATAHAESVDELHRRRLYRMLLETGVFRRALVLRADQQFAEEEIGL